MQRPVKATPRQRQPKNGPISTRHVLEDLTPALRPVALEMAGGDWTRIRILSRGSFEIVAPESR